MALHCVRNDFRTLAARLEGDRNYLLMHEKKTCDCVFIELRNVVGGQVIQSKCMICVQTKQTVDVYSNGW